MFLTFSNIFHTQTYIENVDPFRQMPYCMFAGVSQVVLTGVFTNYCVEGAVRDGADKGFLVTLVPDACAALTQTEHDQSVKEMTDFARICTSDEVVREINDWQWARTV